MQGLRLIIADETAHTGAVVKMKVMMEWEM